jgi:hypothetical protein
MKKMYFVIINSKDEYFLLLNEQKSITVHKTKQEALDVFGAGYEEFASRGGTWATSAVIHWMSIKPFVIEVEEMSALELVQLLQDSEAPNLKYAVLTSDVMPGGIKGLPIKKEIALKYNVGLVGIF